MKNRANQKPITKDSISTKTNREFVKGMIVRSADICGGGGIWSIPSAYGKTEAYKFKLENRPKPKDNSLENSDENKK